MKIIFKMISVLLSALLLFSQSVFTSCDYREPLNSEASPASYAKENAPPNPEAYPEFYQQGGQNGNKQTGDSAQEQMDLFEGARKSLSSPSSSQFSSKRANISPQKVSSGSKTENIVVIPIQFTDVTYSGTNETVKANLATMLNDLKDYYEKNSGYVSGTKGITLNCTIADIVTSANSKAWYGKDSSSSIGDDAFNGPVYDLAREAVTKADPNVDFSIFDSDSNNIIDHIIIVNAGYGQEEGNPATTDDIWSHSWSIGDAELLVDGKRASNYICVAETSELGIYAHEFCHDLGLPDLYDVDGEAGFYDLTTGKTNGAGDWDVMSSGSWNHMDGEAPATKPSNLSAWSRAFLGWITPENISEGEKILTNTDNYKPVFKFWFTGDTSGNEYYLAEYRQKQGYDAALPGEGLLIWHVDQQWINELLDSNGINVFKARLGVELEQADGNWDLWLGGANTGDSGDPFPGAMNNRYYCNVPSAFTYSNIYNETLKLYPFNYVTLKDITVAGNSISANYYLTPRKPGDAPAVSKPVNNANINGQPQFEWNVVPQAEKYIIQVCTSNSFSSGITEFTIDTGTQDLLYSNGVYTYQLPLNTLTPGAYYYYHIAGSNPLSNTVNYVWSGTRKFGIIGAAPSVTFSFDGLNRDKLMGATTDMEYSLNAGAEYLPVTQNDQLLTQAEISQITGENNILIRYKNTELHPASNILTIDILPSPASPAVTEDDTNNIVFGIDNTMEYSTDGGASWTLYNPSNPPDLTGDVTLQVRTAASGLTPVSAVTVLNFNGASITAASDGSIEEGLENGEVITVSMSEATFIGTIDASKIILAGLPEGISIGEVQRLSDTTLSITLSGNSTADYDTNQTVTVSVSGDQVIPAQTPAANATFLMPATLEAAPELPDPFVIFSFDGENAGKVINVTMAAIEFEYSLDGGSNYVEATTSCQLLTNIELNSITAENDIRARIKANFRIPASAAQIIDILPGPAAPAVTGNDTEDTVTGINSTMEFSTDSVNWTRYDGTLPDLTGNVTLRIRIPGAGQTAPGNSAVLTFTAPAPYIPPFIGGFTGVVMQPFKPDAAAFINEKDINEQFSNQLLENITAKIPDSADNQSIALTKGVFDKLEETGKSLTLEGKDVNVSLQPSAIDNSLLDNAGDGAWVKFTMDTISETDADKVLADAAENDGKGLFAIGGRVFEFTCEIITENKTQAVTSFNADVTVMISLSDQDMTGIDMDKLGVYRYNETLKKWEYHGGHYDAETNTITFTTSHFSLYSIMEFEKTFTDTAVHWAKAEIEKMAAKHIALGYGNDMFKPDNTITRAEFYAFLVRALELKDESVAKMPAGDVKSGLWYYKELSIAFGVGIATADDGLIFRPDANITREEMAVAIARAIQIKLNVSAPSDEITEEILFQFKDHDEISNAAKKSVAMAVQKSIIKGKPGLIFDPITTATRAEAMVMIKRLLDLF